MADDFNFENDPEFSFPDDSAFTSDLDLDELLAGLNLSPVDNSQAANKAAPKKPPVSPKAPPQRSAPAVTAAPTKAPQRSAPAATKAPPQRPAPAAPKAPPKQEQPRPIPEEQSRPMPEEPSKPGSLTDRISRHHRVINLCLIFIALLLVGAIAWVILQHVYADPYDGRIVRNVRVAGVDVGGMTKSEAVNTVEATVADRYSKTDMVVSIGTAKCTITPEQSLPNLQVAEAVNAAFSYGRTGSLDERQEAYHKAQTNPVNIDLTPYLGINYETIRNLLAESLSKISGEYVPSGYQLVGDRPALDADGFDKSVPTQTLVLSIGKPGTGFDLDGITNAVLQGYSEMNFQVDVPREYLADFPEPLDIDAIYKELHVDAVEATKQSGEVVPGSCGYSFPLNEVREKLASANFGDTISVPMEYLVPQKLDINGDYTYTLSSFSTPIGGDEAYLQNMKRVAKSLDRTVVQAGANFSFNQTAEARILSNGYVETGAYGEYGIEKEIGGGANQIASTLYAAALCADLTVTEKHPAEHICGYATLGTELTVGHTWEDLKFRNQHKFPVLIRVKVSSTQVTVQILGQQPLDYYIKLESESTYTMPFGTVQVTRSSADGFTNKQVLTEGTDGAQVKLHRIKYSTATNEELERKYEFVQIKPINKVIANVYN